MSDLRTQLVEAIVAKLRAENPYIDIRGDDNPEWWIELAGQAADAALEVIRTSNTHIPDSTPVHTPMQDVRGDTV